MIKISERHQPYLVCLGLALSLMMLVFILYGDALNGNWRADDPQILVHVVKYPLWQSFISPVVWQELSPANLTPWVVASFKLDMLLAGLAPSAFYIHQLLAIWLAAIAAMLLLSLWCNLRYCIAGTVLFLSGAPLVAVSNNLMTRHYIEGLVFAALALYFAVLFLRSNNTRFLVVSCLLYALSMTAKEIFVPLVVFLPFLREGQGSARIKLFVSFAVFTVIYAIWRSYMLQNLIGGYASAEQLFTLTYVLDALKLFLRIPFILLGAYWPLFAISFLALLGTTAWLERWKLLVSFVVCGLILAPLIPLAQTPEVFYPGRYYLLIWFAFALSLPLLLNAIFTKFPGKFNIHALRSGSVIALLTLTTVLLFSQQSIRQQAASANTPFDVQANFIWNNSKQSYFLPSDHVLNAYWFYRGLRDLKDLTQENASSPISVPDMLLLTEQSQPLYQYDAQCQCMVDISGSLAGLLEDHRSRVRPAGELKVRFSFVNNIFSWNFGPYQGNNYYAISDFLGAIRLPQAGEVKLYYVATTLPLVIGYLSEDGSKVYSDELVISHNAPEVQWSRP